MKMKLISVLCAENGITIEELIQKTGIDIERFEKHRTEYHGVILEDAIKIAEALELKVPDLFEKRIPGTEPKRYETQDPEEAI